jgi:hypothetical protein
MARPPRTPAAAREELATLAQRLETGWTVIDAEPDRTKREKQVDFWLGLLASYQRLADWLHNHT